MITTRRAPRTQRLLVAAFGLSLLIHLVGGALWAHTSQLIARSMRRLTEPRALEQEVAISDAIHLERRTIPRPTSLSRSQPEQRHAALRQPRPAGNEALATRPGPSRPAARRNAPAPAVPPVVSRKVPHAAPHLKRPDVAKVPSEGAPRVKGTLSAAQLAKLRAQFARTIAASHVDLATIQKQIQARPVATRRYPLQFAGVQATLQRGEGYIEPTTMGQRVGGTVWYYTHYTYMWPDGHLEDDDIPWPFRYPVEHDLFALHIHLIPLQLPPPGFHLTRALKPFLARFLLRAGRS